LPLQRRIEHRLNIVERRRWVRPYLGCYLSLADDDRSGVLENCPLPHHFTTREEELLEIDVKSLNTLRASFVKVSRIGLIMLFLSRSDPLVSEFPPFMFHVYEVVDSPAESPKCIATRIKQGPKAPARSCRNRAVRFCRD
jgi:hypothetical protein